MKRISDYNPAIPIIFNFNFGHVDPIIQMLIVGKPRINTIKEQIQIEII